MKADVVEDLREVLFDGPERQIATPDRNNNRKKKMGFISIIHDPSKVKILT
jgi:hypothetical protein